MRSSPRTRSRIRPAAVVVGPALGLLLVAVAVLWGAWTGPGPLNVAAAPFQGTYRLSLRAAVPGLVLGGLGVAVLPTLAARLPWGRLLVVAWAAAAAWAVSLAAWDGHRGLAAPIDRPHEYLAALPAVGDHPRAFLADFAAEVAQRHLPVHVNGHPPLVVLVFWGWDRILPGPGWSAALVIAVGSSAVVALAVVLSSLGHRAAARRVLPFLVLGPFAITIATSADAFFLGVAAWSAAALAVGMRQRSWPLLLVAGLLAGALPYLSYGLLPFGAVLATVAVLGSRAGRPGRRGAVLLGTAFAAGLLVVPTVLTAAGFWWWDGVRATHVAWARGRGDDRPYLYSFVADFAVLVVLAGPATLAAAGRVRRTAVAALSAAALVALLALAASGVTRLEVERIWLPYAPWLMLLTAYLPGRTRPWLAANAALAVVFQALVLDVW